MTKSINSKAFKLGAIFIIFNFITKGIAFLTTPVFTRLLTHNEFGMFNNYSSWLSILGIFVTLNLESTLISARFDYEDNFDGYILSMVSLGFLNTFLWFVLVNLKCDFFEYLFDLDIKYINGMLLYLLFMPAINMFQSRERYYFKYKKTILTSTILAVGTALLSVYLVINLSDGLLGRVTGAVIPTVIVGVAIYVYIIKNGKKIDISHWRYALPICLPYIPHLLSMTLLNSTDRVMITKICGSEETALYSLAYSCSAIITLLLISLNGAFAPWLGEKIRDNDFQAVRDFSYKYIFAFFFMSLGIMLLSPEVLYILGGESYMEAIYVLAPVSMGCMFQFLYTMFVNIEQFKKKTTGMAIASVVAALLNFGLNLVFIPRFGYIAAAYTTLAGYFLLLLMHMLLVKKLGFQELYDYKFIGIIIIAGIIIMEIIMILYSYPILRYITIFIYTGILICLFMKYNKSILFLIKNRG